MLSVIVPTREERENVGALLERTLPVLAALDEDAELLVVDGASGDGTAEATVEAAGALGASEVVRVLARERDEGLAAAVLAGFTEARGDVVAVMDADLSHPPETLPALLSAIRHGGAAMAVASRRVRGGGVRDWPWHRRAVSRAAMLLARPLAPVRDTTSGFFALEKARLEGVTLRPVGFKIALEILVRARPRPVVEVPYVFTDRTRGRSKLGAGVTWAYVRQLASLYAAALRFRSGRRDPR